MPTFSVSIRPGWGPPRNDRFHHGGTEGTETTRNNLELIEPVHPLRESPCSSCLRGEKSARLEGSNPACSFICTSIPISPSASAPPAPRPWSKPRPPRVHCPGLHRHQRGLRRGRVPAGREAAGRAAHPRRAPGSRRTRKPSPSPRTSAAGRALCRAITRFTGRADRTPGPTLHQMEPGRTACRPVVRPTAPASSSSPADPASSSGSSRLSGPRRPLRRAGARARNATRCSPPLGGWASPPVATNAVVMAHPEDWPRHRLLRAISPQHHAVASLSA